MLIAGAAAVASVVGVSGTASAGVPPTSLAKGNSLNTGNAIYSYGINGIWYEFILQSDGNLVEYYHDLTGYECVVWASGTNGDGGNLHATYQQDGNFVLYTAAGKALWASNTRGVAGSTVNMNSSGDFYVGVRMIHNGACLPVG